MPRSCPTDKETLQAWRSILQEMPTLLGSMQDAIVTLFLMSLPGLHMLFASEYGLGFPKD